MNAIDLEAGLRSSPYVDALLSSPNVFVHDTYLTIGGRRYDVAWDGRFAVRWQEVVGVLLCMVAARSAAMAFNRIADRKIDAGNARTARRHLPAGLLSLGSVVVFAVLCAAAFIASTLLFLPNWLPIALSVPVLLFLLAYSYTKRFTSLAHFWLGAALMLAPICAWIAIRGQTLLTSPLDILPAVVLGAAVLLWVAGFDIIYACQDFEFDRQAKLKSVPARLGLVGSLRLAAVCHAGMIATLALLPLAAPQLHLGLIYGLGVAAVAVLLIVEHALVRPDDLDRVNTAFFHVNAVVSVGLFLIVTLDLLV
ncbi:MAG: putative 4-hydroxybenzoate polyprenyltransferase [Planctomycetales bacterium]|nr:putative 4-hydroxybenzoate polyprenyltransferase [Planctomycetales bacterium]